jgi:S1-C subfamily serine protease
MFIHRKFSLDELYKSTLLGVITLVLVVGCSSNIPLIGSASSADSTEADLSASAPASQASIPASLTDEQAVLIDLYKRVNPSVVNIAAYGGQSGFPEPAGPGGRIPGGPGGPPGPSQGSGFVYDQAGYIVTNAHVVAGSNQIETTFADGTITEAVIVGLDPDSDLAVLKVAQLPAGVKALPLGNMNELAVGQTVVAIGNPFGLEGTLTRGIISALGRTIPALTPFSIPHAIQTDAAINPGNSGGPLLDLQGRVVGVTAQGVTSGDTPVNSGVSLAIPVDIVSRVVPALIENGQYEWAWLGVIAGDNVTPALVRAMNLPVQSGAYVVQTAPGGPADQAGLRGANNVVMDQGRPVEIGGDVITAINGQPVRSSDDLLTYIALQTRPGQDVTLTVVRSGTTQEIPLRIGVRPAQQSQSAFGRP